MSVTQFETAGLAKLAPEELAYLESWLAGQVTALVETAVASAKREAAPVEQQVIESSISGEFEGWEGDTTFVLENGQVWQQTDYSYHYHYAYRPEVLIVKTTGGWTMIIEDMEERVSVTRLR